MCVCCLVCSVSLWVLCITRVEMGCYLLITLNRKERERGKRERKCLLKNRVFVLFCFSFLF